METAVTRSSQCVRELRLAVLLNHAIAIDGDVLRVEAAEASLIAEVRRGVGALTIYGITASDADLGGRVSCEMVDIQALNVLPHRGLFRLLNYIAMLVLFPFWLRRHDHLYIFFPGHVSILGGLWSRLTACNYSLYVRGIWGRSWGIFRALEELVLKRARFLIVTGSEFQRRLGRIHANVVNEVPLLTLYEHMRCFSGERRYAQGVRRLLFVGRLEMAKGVGELLVATKLLKDRQFKELQVRLIGGGAPRDIHAVRGLIRELDLTREVQLAGLITSPEQLTREYEGADVFVFPSYYAEGFPRVYHEAMGFALPMVTCGLPGTAGYLVHGRNCLICKPRDPVDLADKLQNLIEQPEKARALGRQAFLDFRAQMKEFRHESHGAQFIDLLRARG